MLKQQGKYKMNNSTGCNQFKSIGRLLVVLVALIFFGITYFNSPATAATNNDKNSYLVSLVPPSKTTPIFDPAKVSLGITPTGWSNGDDPSIDLYPRIPYQQILSEMALAGFKGSQTSGKYPEDIGVLKRELKLRNLTISEPWVGTEFTVGKTDETWAEFKKQVQFMKQIGGSKSIVVAELGNAVHQQPVAPLPNRPKFTDEQWNALTQGLNQLGKKAKEEGMQISYHPHIGTGVENLADIDRLMANTNPEYVNLLLDTGHLYYAGVDPLEVTKKYGDRIKHVHLKNIRKPVLDESIKKGWSFLGSIKNGIFTVPGDTKEGAIEFKPILNELANANYEGWLIVEAEQDPNKTNPLKNALIARSYLRDVTGL
ncbi:MAG: myo-inosose-2 dehydratase [Nostoc sp. CmiVER01]|uniref:myo-inosose-2 dehydratase n=1 Tax=Nostoc sp. CmiVER01 TaxID=3075384 RepID=UPI002AD54524|nr:myo-inosose-2 dehydratase [Nostoc sp. CmiVER01]MDZ8126211.1 myo-inosose-2 dehydratase [Nostoc sp. CmiVER01]